MWFPATEPAARTPQSKPPTPRATLSADARWQSLWQNLAFAAAEFVLPVMA